MSTSRPSVSDQRRFWNEHWQQWTERNVLNAWAFRRNETILELLQSLELPPVRILDLGCGPGWFTESFTSFGTVTGIDLSAAAIAMARARAPHVDFIVGDFYRTPLPLDRLDVVVSQEVLGHVEDQSGYIDCAADMLRPGGHLILATPNRFVLDRLGGTAWAAYPPAHIDTHVSRTELRRLIERRFRLLRMTTIIPIGHGGILRVTNSLKFNRMLAWLLTDRRVTALKERAGLGYQIIVLAQKAAARMARGRESA